MDGPTIFWWNPGLDKMGSRVRDVVDSRMAAVSSLTKCSLSNIGRFHSSHSGCVASAQNLLLRCALWSFAYGRRVEPSREGKAVSR